MTKKIYKVIVLAKESTQSHCRAYVFDSRHGRRLISNDNFMNSFGFRQTSLGTCIVRTRKKKLKNGDHYMRKSEKRRWSKRENCCYVFMTPLPLRLNNLFVPIESSNMMERAETDVTANCLISLNRC